MSSAGGTMRNYLQISIYYHLGPAKPSICLIIVGILWNIKGGGTHSIRHIVLSHAMCLFPMSQCGPMWETPRSHITLRKTSLQQHVPVPLQISKHGTFPETQDWHAAGVCVCVIMCADMSFPNSSARVKIEAAFTLSFFRLFFPLSSELNVMIIFTNSLITFKLSLSETFSYGSPHRSLAASCSPPL